MKKYYLTALVFGSGLALAGTALAGDDCGEGKGKGKGKAEHFNHLDANKDGRVTLTELSAAREGWLTKVDANKDGVATAAELEASRQAGHAERMQRMFANKDANKDGRLTREESRFPERWFAQVDTNKDGALTQAELAQKPKRGGKPEARGPKGRHADRFGQLDENKDGNVDRAEVQKAAARMLQHLDKNSDGALTADEMRGPGRGHGKQHRGPDGKGVTDPAKKAPAPRTQAS